MHTIADYMIKDVAYTDVGTGLRDAIKLMRDKGISSLLVNENGKCVGIFTERDLLTRFDLNAQGGMDAIKVGDLMTKNIKTVEAGEPYIKAIEFMKQEKIRHIPVIKDGDIVGIVSLRDLLMRYEEHLEQLVKEREAEFESLFVTFPAAVTVTDKEERIVVWNPFALQLLGMDEDDLRDKPVQELYPPQEWQRIRDLKIRELGMKHHVETKVINKRGELIDVDLSVSVFKDEDGNIIGSIAVMHNVANQQREKFVDRTKGYFLSKISDMVSEPMRTVIDFTQLLDKTKLDEDQKTRVNKIYESGVRLREIIDDILDISKIEARDAFSEGEEFDLQSVIAATINMVKDKLKPSVDIFYHFKHDTPIHFLGDPTGIKHIILNLLNNAVRYTEKGQIEVTVGSDNDDGQDKKDKRTIIRISVKDTGSGIDADRQKTLFDVLPELSRTSSNKPGHKGLGLAICRSFVEMYGGRIWVESEPGQGSEFIFTLRLNQSTKDMSGGTLAQEQAQPDATGTQERPTGDGEFKGLKVIVADDNVQDQREIVKLLTGLGCMADTAYDGQDALDKIAESVFNILLISTELAVMNAFDVADELTRGGYKDMTIIGISSKDNPQIRDKVARSVIKDLIIKPINIEKLKIIFRKHIKH